MAHLYGDSSPFPYDVDYIDLLRHAVDCSVQLLSAQHAIEVVRERARQLAQAQEAQRLELSAFWDSMRQSPSVQSVKSERAALSMSRVLEAARAALDEEMAGLERETAKETSQEQVVIERAVETAGRAVESLLLTHDVPETSLGLRLLAEEESVAAEVAVQTPFGLDAVIALLVPPGHEWSRPRRVGDLQPGLEISLPQESGWLSKRVELTPVKLDRLYVSAVTLNEVHASIALRKNAASGEGYQLRVTFEETPRVVLDRLLEEGEAHTPLALEGEDRIRVLKLWGRISETTASLPARRQRLLAATFEGVQLARIENPAAIAERLIAQLAPTVREIGRRSGAPSELVLRRDLGQGRREEIYVTRGELEQKIQVLPPDFRAAFAPLELSAPTSAGDGGTTRAVPTRPSNRVVVRAGVEPARVPMERGPALIEETI